MNRLLLVGAAAAIAGCASFSRTGNSGTHYVRDAMMPVIENGQFPGAISYLYDDGRTEIALMGYSDIRNRRPVSMNDLFQQCSQTKGFCGVCIAKLAEEGKLSIYDPVSKYLPEFGRPMMYVYGTDTNGTKIVKRTYRQIRILDVMNHTSGIPMDLPMCLEDYPGGGWFHGAAVRARAVEAAGNPLEFEPGLGVRYSNTGIDVGAAVIEAVTGMPWEKYLQKKVLDPLGMKDTTFRPTERQLRRRMYVYSVMDFGKGPCEFQEPPNAQPPFNGDGVFASAGAGLWTTVNDQLKFYKMLMNLGLGENGNRILKEETVKNLLATDYRPGHGLEAGYSLGFWVDPADTGWFGHGGAWGTSCTVNWKTKQLKLWACQQVGWGWKYLGELGPAQDRFFGHTEKNSVDAYTGRMN